MIGVDLFIIFNLFDVDCVCMIVVNMEWLCWFDCNLGVMWIDVNLVVVWLSYWCDGKLVESCKVVVGELEYEML